MTSKFLFPSLDTDGWINTPVKVADALASHFFLSDYSQTSEFKGQVASFAWLIQRHQNDITRLMQETQTTLSNYFSQQFDAVDVEITEIPNADSINQTSLSLYLTFTDKDGVNHNLARIIRYSGLKVNEIIAVINQG